MIKNFLPTTPGLWANLVFLLHFNIECSRQCSRFPTTFSHKWLKVLAYTKVIINKHDSLPSIHAVGALYLSLQEQRIQKKSSSHNTYWGQFITSLLLIFKEQSTATELTVATQLVMLGSPLKASGVNFVQEHATISILFYRVRLSHGSRKDKML